MIAAIYARKKSAPAIVALLALFLAGCVSRVPMPGPGEATDATFVHPTTGDVRHCENPGATMVYRGGIAAANAYADCKTNAEEQGYVRRRGDK
jgi:PBP1b-binding outer membrane lipoprotein LpoB